MKAATVETLLAHRDWVRALARSLVADPAQADDVAQQTMLEAIARPPRDAGQPRGWLRAVARNAARALGRQERRLKRREQAVARDELVETDPADTAHRAAMHKRLVDELFALEEPYHTVVLLRFFDDLDARQTAVRLNRPLATVRTQLQRGLDRLRQRLDREYGDRRAWCTALLPLCAARPAAVGVPVLATLGALAMWKWMLAATAALCAVLIFTFDPFSAPPPMPAANAADTAMAVQASPGDDERKPSRTEVPAEDRAATVTTPVATGGSRLRGRVITVDGQPVIGLTLAWRDPETPRLEGTTLHVGSTSMDLDQPALRGMLADEEGIRAFAPQAGVRADVLVALLRGEKPRLPRATTDAEGRFELAANLDVDRLGIEDSDLIRYGIGKERGSTDPVLVVGPGVRVKGHVVDEQGNGLEGIHLGLSFSLESLPGFTQQLEHGGFRSWNENSRSDGRFDLGVVPAHPALEVVVQKRGYQTLTFRAADVVSPVIWTLRRAAPAPFVLSGTVRHGNGTAAARATVTFGQDAGAADERGQFRFELTYFRDDTQLLAWLPGLQPALVEGLGTRLQQNPAAGSDLALVLGDRALEISGRVLDASGKPRAGMTVVLGNGVVNGSFQQFLESAIGNQRSSGEVTGADGTFTLRGLSARDYTVRAIDRQSLLVVESPPVKAGTRDLTLREPADAFWPRLHGVLVDRHGLPVQGATVRVRTILQPTAHGASLLNRPEAATTDDQGRFVIENCPRRHVTLSIDGTDVAQQEARIPADGAPLQLQVARALRFTIQGSNAPADRFAVLDSTGARILSTAHKPDVESSDLVHRFEPDLAPVYEVDDRAAALLLLNGKTEVRKVALTLRAGELNRVEL